MKFFSIWNDWTTYEFWIHLKKRYSTKWWSSKWATYNKLEILIYKSFITDVKSKTLNILIELKSQNLIIDQIVTLKVFNILKLSFFTYLIVLIKSARKKNKFSKFEYHKTGHWRSMWRIKKKNHHDQSKKKSSQSNESITSEITLMIKRLIKRR